MIQKLKILGVALISAVALNSCGGEGGDPLDNNSTFQVLTAFLGASGGGGGGVISSLPSSNTPPPLPGMLSGLSPASSGPIATVAGCETIDSTGDTPDGDGIDTLKTYTFDCTDVINGGNKYTQKGKVIYRDLDVNVAGVEGGMRVDIDVPVFKYFDVVDDRTYESTYAGFFEYKKIGSSIVSTSEFTGSNKYAYNIGENDYTYTSTWNWALTPDDPNNIWTTATGKIEFRGTFLLSGKFINEVNGVHTQAEGSFFVNYYSENLTYDDSCAGAWYKNGSLFVEDANGTKIEIRYVNCTGKLYINGTESDLWVP